MNKPHIFKCLGYWACSYPGNAEKSLTSIEDEYYWKAIIWCLLKNDEIKFNSRFGKL